jgi:uncharacterized protein with HEPN domain
MLEAIHHVQRYTAAGRERFDADELVQSWTLRHLQVIGEAARALSAGLRDAHPEIPWRDIIGMRQILVHHYFGIDLNAVWTAVEGHLPSLRQAITAILDEPTASQASTPGERCPDS